MSGGGGVDATTEPAEVVHQPGPDEAMDADEEFAVRMVETVDAALRTLPSWTTKRRLRSSPAWRA